MKRFLYEYFPAWLLLTVFAFIVIHAPLTVFVGTHFPGIATAVKAWKEVCMGLAGILIAIEMARRRQWHSLRVDYLGWVIMAYWALHIVALAWTHASLQEIVAGLLIDLRYTFFAACVYHFVIMYPQYRQSFIRVGLVGAVIVIGFATLQLVLPHDILKYLGYSNATIAPYLTVDRNPDYIRLNSTLRGPNPLGAYAVIALACCGAYILDRYRHLKRQREQVGVIALATTSLIALWMSYSRSALIAGILAVLLVLAIRYGRRLPRRVWYVGAASLVLVAVLGVASQRTTFIENVVYHNNPSTGSTIDSNAAHATSLQNGVKRALAEPLGSGIGSTGSASLFGSSPLIIENQYLMIAHEVGWLGLVLFVAIYVIFLQRIWQQRRDWLALGVWTSGIGLAFIGILLPVWADDTVSLIWWGLAAVVLAKGGLYGPKANKKATRIA